MPILGQDIQTAFLSSTHSDPSRTSLYVQTATGDVIKVYNPNDNLLPGASQGDFATGTAVQVGDALYFAETQQFGNPDDGFINETYVCRLNRDGTVDRLVNLPGISNHGGQSGNDPLLSAYQQGGTYHIQAGPELFAIAANGMVTQQTHLARAFYPGVLPGIAVLNDTTFVIGDQQTPSGPNELYRIRANGAQELVFSGGVGTSVTDVESFGGKAWFITQKGDALATHQTLWTIGENGAKQKFSLGKGQEPTFLDTNGGGLTVVYHPAGGARFDSIARIGLDGTVTTIMNATFTNGISDVCTLDGQTYFTSGTSSSGGSFLYRVTANGKSELVAGIGNGVPDPDVNGMHVSGGKLWFTGALQIPDGFGGHTAAAVSYSIDANGVVTVESGIPGHRPDLFVIEGYNFTLDFPDPVIGTDDPETLNGTAKGELLSGLDGDDTLFAHAGADTVLGGLGDDILDGGRDNDVLQGGFGGDTLVGSLGNDTLTGGLGQDTFLFADKPSNRGNMDTITDFASGLDHIELALVVMAQLGPAGVLSADAFWSSSTAVKGHDATDRVIYNTSTGTLYYDADGIGGAKAVKIAELGSFTQLDYTDILVV